MKERNDHETVLTLGVRERLAALIRAGWSAGEAAQQLEDELLGSKELVAIARHRILEVADELAWRLPRPGPAITLPLASGPLTVQTTVGRFMPAPPSPRGLWTTAAGRGVRGWLPALQHPPARRPDSASSGDWTVPRPLPPSQDSGLRAVPFPSRLHGHGRQCSRTPSAASLRSRTASIRSGVRAIRTVLDLAARILVPSGPTGGPNRSHSAWSLHGTQRFSTTCPRRSGENQILYLHLCEGCSSPEKRKVGGSTPPLTTSHALGRWVADVVKRWSAFRIAVISE